MARILLHLDHSENRRLLAEWLSGEHEVVQDGAIAEAAFDLCVLDVPALGRLNGAIETRKAQDAPVFLPFLLVAHHERLPERIWSLVDEVIFVPTDKGEMRARLESLLRARRLSLELSQRYEALQQYDRRKDEFLSVITHELRSPLTSILGYAEMLEDEIAGPLTDGQRDFVRWIERDTDRVNRLVTDLLDFARVETGTFKLLLEEGDLREQIDAALTSMRPQAEAGKISLVATVPEEPLSLVHDAQRLVQVFTNLISNAIKFTPPGGTIQVRTRREGDSVRCEVADTGPGIAPEDIPKLFKRFSQLEAGAKKKGSTGLGLSICKTIVEAHGGHIGVESTPGLGATFWFTLPMYQSEPSST